MNLCINGTIESSVDTLRARVEYNMDVKGGNAFCAEWHLSDLWEIKFIWLGNIINMGAMGAMLNTAKGAQWDAVGIKSTEN